MAQQDKVRIAIRADGNSSLGMGHLMRCLSIAGALKRQQAECVFLVAETNAGSFIEEKGFECIVLETDYKDMESERARLEEIWQQQQFSLVLIDSYQITQNYLYFWMKHCPVFYMDDMGTQQLQADGIVNYNVYAKELGYEQWNLADTRLLLGAEYAPVREAFLQTPYFVREQVSRIMITMGGSDMLNIAGRLSERLLPLLGENVELMLICGRFNPHLEKLQKLQKADKRVNVLVDVPDMWNKMAQADIAVSAAGSTMYELSTLGVPTICCYYVENQRRIAEGFAKVGSVINVGDFSAEPEEVLQYTVRQVLSMVQSYEKRVLLSQCIKDVSDGQGAQRLAEALLESCRVWSD